MKRNVLIIYIIDTTSFLSGNNTDNNISIGDWVKNADMLQYNEGDK